MRLTYIAFAAVAADVICFDSGRCCGNDRGRGTMRNINMAAADDENPAGIRNETGAASVRFRSLRSIWRTLLIIKPL